MHTALPIRAPTKVSLLPKSFFYTTTLDGNNTNTLTFWDKIDISFQAVLFHYSTEALSLFSIFSN